MDCRYSVSLIFRVDLSKVTVFICFCLLSEESIASDPVFKGLRFATQHVVENHSESVRRGLLKMKQPSELAWCTDY